MLKRGQTSDSGSQRAATEKAKRDIIAEFERKIRDMESEHKREISRLNAEKHASQSSTGKAQLETLKSQLNDDFERRLKTIQ